MDLNGKHVALILAGVGFLFVVLFAALGGVIFWLVWQATAEPVQVTRAHLEALNRDDYSTAYGHLSTSLKAELSQEQFAGLVRQNPQVFKTSDSTFSHREIKNDVCTLRGTVTSREGGKTPVRVTLVKEGEQWRIRGFRWGEGAADEDES
jgi:hypothetical protein